MLENSVMAAQDPYGRYRQVPPQMVHGDRLISRESEYHRSLAQQHMDRADGQYNLRSSQAASHVLQPQPAYTAAPSYSSGAYVAAPSYAPPASHAPVEYAPYQATSYHPTIAYENPNQVYNNSHQTPASVWVSLAAEGNAPVSSMYSFPGPTPTYR
ncbi:hypothetical protein FRX31_004254 [Thalictrum thalictroides]|uniref:Uncharacterized protein n=1 Tax=Thalictrum thalictroides TaxID=46969 RepID=A0A7J6X944_THATH|nr:hypothetical protein FRX31_004254 [Thalictrum thalictroides]